MDSAADSDSSDLPHSPAGGSKFPLLLGALGVVYGDIGTSPLYAIRECFSEVHHIEPTEANVLGVLSLVVWSLIVVIGIKYMAVVMRADNRGEGGVLALMALALHRQTDRTGRIARTIVLLGLLGAALLYSDGMITPAISILGAMEGLDVLEPALERYVVPMTLVILFGLFLVQRWGTARLGRLFGPILIVWFSALALTGIVAIVGEPAVLWAFNPLHIPRFFLAQPWNAFEILGSVFLVVTGGEALYADMGHFGRRPIQVDWFAFVLPCLTLNYLGQGALILGDPETIANPFYALAPRWALAPMILLATLAAIIASQAVISGAFSLTRQAVLLGYLPRLSIRHTSSAQMGQIYVPAANWLLMLSTMGLVVGFGDSSGLASAYGVAVTTTMLFTTLLLAVVARRRWNWGWPAVVLVTCIFLVFDIGFFGAALLKVAHGGWFPILIGVIVCTVMVTWHEGRQLLAKRRGDDMPLEAFVENITTGDHQPVRVPGSAVFLTASPVGTPRAMGHNIRHNKVLHKQVTVLTVVIQDIPHVPAAKRVRVENLGHGITRVIARYGFMESPDVPEIVAACEAQDYRIPLYESAFFLGREFIRIGKSTEMPRWRQTLFSYLSRTSQNATNFFNIPSNQAIELGLHVQL